MLRPSPAALVAAVAEVLAGEVADGIEPGPARDQVRDAAAVLKRVARALPDFTTFLLEDIHDLAGALERLGRPVELPPDLPKASDPVGLEALTELALDLRERLAGVAEQSDLSPEAERELRAALGRLVERDASLRLSPWER